MAMSTAANMLRQYNQKDKKEAIGQQADGTKRGLASWSYTNPYDALYDKYKNNKNFNARLWHDAVSRGEQDNYLAFLEKNKDATLSDEFYDPEYYDYESMMLELYLPLADKENVEKRTRNVFDQVNHKWVEEDIGEMSDYDYLAQQLEEARTLKSAQIQRQLEQDHKDEQSFLKNLWTHTAATGMEVGEGIISALAGLGDVFGALGYASARNIGDAIRGENMDDTWSWGDYFVEYYGKGLLASEKEVLRAQLDEYERTHTYFRDVDGNITGWGTYIAGVANSIGMMIPAIVINALTAGTAGTAMSAVQGVVGSGTFYASIFSQNMYENATDASLVDTPAWNKILNAGTKTAVEAVVEYALGKVLGGTIQNNMLGIKGKSAKALAEIGTWTGAKYMAKSALQEGLEEFIQDFSTSCIDEFMGMWQEGYAKRADGVNIQTLLDSFFAGVLSSLVLSGTSIGVDSTRSLLINHKARKSGEYEGYKVLPGDLAIEKTVKTPKLKDGKPVLDKDGNTIMEEKTEVVEVRGWNKLYLKSVLQDVRNTLEDLRKGKRSLGDNVKIAQEAYAAVNALTQYYSGFDATRLKNCEELLNRIINSSNTTTAEEFAQVRRERGVEPLRVSDQQAQAIRSADAGLSSSLADRLVLDFVAMTEGVGLRNKEKVHTALREKEDELKENGVTQAKGVKRKKDKEQEKLQESAQEVLDILSEPAKDTLEEMAKDRDFIVVTDGHYAIDLGEIAFVSEAWLENYSVDEIYEFMTQIKLIDTIKSTKAYQPMLTDLLKFVREFTGKQEVNLNHAIFEFLFNSNIYQGFLLSNNGAKVHEYKKFIFKIQEFVYQVAHDSPYVQQKFGKSQMPSQKRINLVHKLYDRIRNAWRIPTLKAILNWGFDPVEVGAYMSSKSGRSAILTEDDMKLVNEWQKHKERLAEPLTGNITQAHINLAEDLIALDRFTDEEIAIIRRGREKDATNDEKLMSRMLLDLVDEYRIPRDISSQIAVLPPSAISHANDPATAQWIADKLKEFEVRYGISADQMISGVLSGMTNEQRRTLEEDMQIYGHDSVVTFVPAKLEDMLGPEYVTVIPYDKNFVTSTLSVSDFNETVNIDQQNLVSEKFEHFMTDALLIRDWLEYHRIGKRMTSAQYDELIEDFENLAAVLLSKNSEYRAHLPSRFARWLNDYNYYLKIGSSSEFIYNYIVNNKSVINEAIDTIIKHFGVVERTGLSEIRIAKKIKADKFLPSYFLDADVSIRNSAIKNAVEQRIKDHYVHELFYWNNFFAAEYGMPKMSAISDAEFMADVASRSSLNELLNELEGDISINPFSGELLEGDALKERDFLIKVLENCEVIDGCHLTDLIDVSNFTDDFKSFCGTIQVRSIEFSSRSTQGSYSPSARLITLSSNADDIVGTLVHEFNHAIQHDYNMSIGGSSEEFLGSSDLINYIIKNYRPLVDFFLRITLSPEITSTNFDDLSGQTIDALSYLAYKMLEGEMHASESIHNTNAVGFRRVRKGSQEYYLAPDNKTYFRSWFNPNDFDENLSDRATSMTPTMADAMSKVYFEDTMKLLLAKQEADMFGYTENDYTRNRFHTRARHTNKYEVLYGITDPSLKLSIISYGISVNDIIQNPQEFLSQEVLATLNGNYSEGNVYYRLKEYIEEHFEGASLDRDSRTHEVIIVDDNAFDDTLKVDLLAEATNYDSASLFDQYHGREGVPISTFYNAQELKRLGIDPNIKVIIDPSVKSEAIRDKARPLGEIHIGINENTSNATFIDRLNHEFRHLLQLYNNLETGFTPNFEATPELIADIKAHVPQLFTDKDLRFWAKKRAEISGRTVDEVIAQTFVYMHTGGELNAYSFSNLRLGTKPIYATYEAGKPTIFMPWYDAKTGEGKHKTKYLSMRSDDLSGKRLKSDKVKLPEVKKKQKTLKVGNVELPIEERAKDTRSRYFSGKKARGTNLYYYVKAGKIDQLDPRMQDFVIATTGHLDKLPKELRHNIEHGLLTRNMLIGWFNRTDRKNINEFTFNLMNKYIFKNDYIRTIDQLDDVLSVSPEFYYGLAIVLRKKSHASLESMIRQNDVDTFMTLISRVESTPLLEEVMKASEKYYNVVLPTGHVSEGVTPDEKFLRSMRSRAMLNFNGSIAGAFRMSKSFKEALSIDEYVKQIKIYSGDKTVKGKENDIGTVFDAIASDRSVAQDTNARQVGNDIDAAYELMEEDKDTFIDQLSNDAYRVGLNDYIDKLPKLKDYQKDLMKKTLANDEWRKEDNELQWKAKHGVELTPAQQSKLKRYDYYDRHVEKLKDEVHKRLESLSIAELKARAAIHLTCTTAGVPIDPALFDPDNNFAHVLSPDEKRDVDIETQRRDVILNRERTVGRIKDSGKAIGRYIREGVITMDDLPDDLKDLFELVKVKEPGTQRVIKEWRINQRLYSVGKGRKALPGNEDKTLKRYQKRNFNVAEDTNELYRHDISELISIDDKLFQFKEKIKDKARELVVAKKAAEKEIMQLKRQNEQQRRKLDKLQKENEELHSTDFRVNKQKEKLTSNPVSDTPNLFSIISPIEMPEKLRNLYDTSFTDFADTKVQFVSKDKDGRYYDKSQMKPKEFDSLVQHEKSNYDKFYQANLTALSELSRQDVFDIIEFIEKGAITADGPMGKLSAFEIYLLGFFVEGARDNMFGWNFSDAEIKHVEKLLENKASEAGMALRAVKEIGAIIDPLKKFIEMQFAEWETLDPEKTTTESPEVVRERRDKLIELIRAGKNNKENGQAAIKALTEAAKVEAEARRKKNGLDKRWSKAWVKSFFKRDKIMSLRMWSMLSGPATWAKNYLSNVTTTAINSLSNIAAKMALSKRAYRADQIDFSSIVVSEEVKNFVEQYVKNNPLFDQLYDVGSKYDPRDNKKGKDTGIENFISLVIASYERQYAANYHLDGTQKSMFAKLVGKMMSDSAFVKRAALKYYSKMLTLDVKSGKIDLSNGLESGTLNLFADAVVLAAQDYMHKRSGIAMALDMIRKEHPNLHGSIMFFFPFINSSMNWWAENFVKLTPIGLIGAINKLNHLEAQIAKVDEQRAEGLQVPATRMTEYLIRRDIGKGIVGTSFLALGVIGAIIGALKIDEDDEKIVLSVGDVKVDVSDVFGSSSILVGAALTQMFIKQADGKPAKFVDSLSYATNVLLEGFFVTDFMSRYRFSDGAFGILMTASEDALKSFVPQFVQFAMSFTNNKNIKYSSGIKGALQRYMNSWIPSQPFGSTVINPYTGEEELKYAIPIVSQFLQKGIFGGVKIFITDIDEGERLCREYSVNREELTGEITVNDETEMLNKHDLNVKYGELNRADLAKIKSQKHRVEMPNGTFKTLPWDKLSDKQRTNVLKNMFNKNAKYAKIYTWVQSGHKYYGSSSDLRELRSLGVTKNVYKGDKGFVE